MTMAVILPADEEHALRRWVFAAATVAAVHAAIVFWLMYVRATGLAGAPFAGGARESSGRARLIEMFMLNSLTRPPDLSGAATALISTSSGFSRYGEAPRLRISVETRAFDWA